MSIERPSNLRFRHTRQTQTRVALHSLYITWVRRVLYFGVASGKKLKTSAAWQAFDSLSNGVWHRQQSIKVLHARCSIVTGYWQAAGRNTGKNFQLCTVWARCNTILLRPRWLNAMQKATLHMWPAVCGRSCWSYHAPYSASDWKAIDLFKKFLCKTSWAVYHWFPKGLFMSITKQTQEVIMYIHG